MFGDVTGDDSAAAANTTLSASGCGTGVLSWPMKYDCALKLNDLV